MGNDYESQSYKKIMKQIDKAIINFLTGMFAKGGLLRCKSLPFSVQKATCCGLKGKLL